MSPVRLICYILKGLVLCLGLVGANLWSANAAGSEWYASWGYSRDYWQPSDIHVVQPTLGNDFTLHQVRASDNPEWDTGIFNKDFSSPQWNARLGWFFDAAKNYALELNFDHSKYTVIPNQSARLSGTVNGKPVNATEVLTYEYFSYALHNGANHIMINLVRRYGLLGSTNNIGSVAFLAKIGGGIMLPHPMNTIMGHDNNVGNKTLNNLFGTHSGWWQLNGYTAGVELGFRLLPWTSYFLELTAKAAYASLSGIDVYEGRADQTLMMTEAVLSLGYSFARP